MTTRGRRAAIAILGAAVLGAFIADWVFADKLEAGAEASSKPKNTSSDPPLSRSTNHLASEASPYLQLHAHNPVDWYPWGEEALARARAESKPIFLSVGYSTCYWCHVMERKVFSDPDIAALMNEHFINIKVDREERPDIDEIYMTATQILTRSGGWPNSLFLTPDAQPFYAGTYFPPEDAYGRPGFPKVLRSMADAWENDRANVIATARRITDAIVRSSDGARIAADVAPNPDTLLEGAQLALSALYESKHGGFSHRTKFPRPSALEVLLVSYEKTQDAMTLGIITKTLDEMALGGIYDQLAGGFHRYSTEPTWSIPHFEKMLYDNAQLIGLYAHAFGATNRPLYRQVVQDIIAYLQREMTHPDGGFFSAQGAEVDGEEGASYVWSRAEVEAVLGKEGTSALLSVYQLAPTREQPSKGVLRVQLPVAPALESVGVTDVADLLQGFSPQRAELLAARNRRDQPLRDEKVLAGWNGLAIRALVDAARILDRPDYVRLAERAAHFVLERLGTPEGGLHRSYIAGQAREDGVLDDYAFLADGLIALHLATSNPTWLEQARAVADTMLARFEDRERGGFFLTVENPRLLLRPKPVEDGALPSGNAVALRVLRRLGNMTAEPRYTEAANRTTLMLARSMQRTPSVMGTAIAALTATPTGLPPLPQVAGQTADSSIRTRFRLSKSEDHVRVRLERDAQHPLALTVQLVIDDGWHLNANPSSLPFLIPTTIEFTDGVEPIRYPLGKEFHPAFSDETLSVYEGRVEIQATLTTAPRSTPLSVAVRYQACDHQRCLPPGISHAELSGGGG